MNFSGRHFEFEDVRIAPSSPQDGGVPFLVAAHWRSGKERQFKRVARLGSGVISISDYPDEYGKVVQRVQHYARALGREEESLERTFYMDGQHRGMMQTSVQRRRTGSSTCTTG